MAAPPNDNQGWLAVVEDNDAMVMDWTTAMMMWGKKRGKRRGGGGAGARNRVRRRWRWEGSSAKGVYPWEGCWLVLGGKGAPNVVGRLRI